MTRLVESGPSMLDALEHGHGAGEQLLMTEKRVTKLSVHAKGDHLEAVERGHEQYQTVRLIADGRFGFQGSRASKWGALMEQARSHAAQGPAAAYVLSDLTSPYEEVPDTRQEPDPDALCKLAVGLSQALQALHPQLVPQVHLRFARQVTRMVDHTRHQRQWTRTIGQVSVSGRIVRHSDFVTVGDQRLGAGAIPDAALLLNAVRDRLEWADQVIELPAGRYPILVRPTVAMSLLTSVVVRLSQPAVVVKTSPWAERVGATVLHQNVSLLSDPTLSDGPRSVPWDDEGTPTRVVPLIQHGTVGAFVLDRQTAAQLGVDAPGTAFAGELGAPPTPRPANLVVTAGEMEEQAMREAYPRLLILEGWIGGRPVNPLRGDIAGTATGLYLVEDGEVVGRVKNAVVSLNAIDAWSSQLVGLSKDRRWVGGGMMELAPGYVPSLLMDDVSIARKSS